MEDRGSKPPINIRHTRIYCAGLRRNGNGNGRIKKEIRRSEIDRLYTREATLYLGRERTNARWNILKWLSWYRVNLITKLGWNFQTAASVHSEEYVPCIMEVPYIRHPGAGYIENTTPPVHPPPSHKSTCFSSLGTAPSVHQTSLPFVEGRETNTV